MSDSLFSRFTDALTTGSACATSFATTSFIVTPGFIADDIVNGATAGVVCGTASFFGIDIKNTILSSWYGVQPTLLETVKQSVPNLLNNTCDAIYSNVSFIPNVIKNTCDAIYSNSTIVPTVLETVSQMDKNTITTDILPTNQILYTAHDVLVHAGNGARSVYDATPYVPYVSEALRAAKPILVVFAVENAYNAVKNGTSLLAAVADTAVRGYALPIIARSSAEMISNVTGLSAEMVNLSVQLVQNAPMKDTDQGANLVRLPLEVKTLILSQLDYPKWYHNKERDLKRQSYNVAEMIKDRQASVSRLNLLK